MAFPEKLRKCRYKFLAFTSGFEKLQVQLEPNLVYWYNVGPLLCSYGQMPYTKVKGYRRSSCQMTQNVKFTSFEKFNSSGTKLGLLML